MSRRGQADMTGRTVVITGGNSGIGKYTAIGIARAGAHTVIVSRNPDRGAAALDEIRAKSGSDQVDLVVGDLGSMASTRKLAEDLLARCPKLHVLVNNAGLWKTERTETADGYEETFAVNHLAPFLLTDRLLERLSESGAARVVNVASVIHKRGHLDFDDLHTEKRPYKGLDVYATSKLCNILFTRELARRLTDEGRDVTTNSLHPGVVATNFGSGNSWLLDFGLKLVAPFILTAEKGARTSIHVATSPAVAGVSGEYFDRSRVARTASHARDDAAARRLWDVSTELCGLS